MKNFSKAQISDENLSAVLGGVTILQETKSNCSDGIVYGRLVEVWSCGHVEYGPWVKIGEI